MNLDVGCGSNPHGNVNVDLYEKQGIHRNTDLKPKQIPNFVKADGHHLPFQSGCFDVVECHHLLEHKGVDHVALCRELVRVAKRRVVITVPRCYGQMWLKTKLMTKSSHPPLFMRYSSSSSMKFQCRIQMGGFGCECPLNN